MAYVGYIDVVRKDLVAGWAFNSRRPNDSIEVELLLGERQPIVAKADRLRDDLLQSGIGNGRHAFEVAIEGNVNLNALRVRVRGADYYLENAAARGARKFGERLNNSTLEGAPTLPWGFSEREPGAEDERVCAEIVAAGRAFGAGGGGNSPRKSELWDRLVSAEHAEFLQLVSAGDVKALARYLCSLPKQRPGEGVLQGARAYRDIFAATDAGKNGSALASHDQLVTLGQYLGVVPLETTEQGEYGRAIHLDPKEVARRVEREIGVSVLSPNVFSDLFGLRVDGGVIEQRGLQGLYAALRMNSIVGVAHPRADAFADPAPMRVCEIGGGFGLAAEFSWRIGFRHYVIVDLPSMLLMQYYYLRMSLPRVAVKFVRDGEAIPEGPGVYLISADAFTKRRSESFDIVVNCDSFPKWAWRFAPVISI